MMKMKETKTSISRGLTSREAARRQRKYGANILFTKKKWHPVSAVLKKLSSPLLIILIVTSFVSVLFGQHTDAAIILVMIFISVVLDIFNTHKSEKSAETLMERVEVTARVRRDGREEEVPIKSIVPGDIVLLGAGDIVPADAQIIEARDFFVNQSALTGESFPVEKRPKEIVIGAGDKSGCEDCVFMGSNVITGSAVIEVKATGAKTQYGAIAKNLAAAAEETDFEKGIRRFSYFILQITVVLVILVFFTSALRQRGIFESFIFALAIAIGLTPELLPVVISVALSRGSLKMAKQDVIVKNLSSIQNFGAMNVLCSDKTGTLTEDKITLVKYVDGFGEVSDRVLLASYLNSMFHTGITSPLDMAIKEFKHLGTAEYKKVDEIPFDFARRRSSVVVEHAGKKILITKGAPEDMFMVSVNYKRGEAVHRFDEAAQKEARKQFDALSADGFRVLAVAEKELIEHKEVYEKEMEQRMIFLGFVAFYDPPKQSAVEAVKELEALGIEIKIITGDSEILTEKICRDIKLPIKGMAVGAALENLNDDELQKLARHTTIFARVNPVQKERVILSLKRAGCVVGYLGDGINDAPAIKAADVGISVNNAVDVAKQTADIILLKKSLRVLKAGVLEGRKTFQNTLKYIMMGLSSNFGNMFSMAGLPLFVPFFPMLPSQILLNNLLYDISQFTIPSDSVDEDDVQKPLRWDIKFLRKFMIVFGPISSIFDFSTFLVMWYVFHPVVAQFQTAWFLESLATQIFVIYIIRTRKIPFLESSPGKWIILSTVSVVLIGFLVTVLPFNHWLGFEPLSYPMLSSIAILLFVYLFFVQIAKVFFYKQMSKRYLREVSPCNS